MLFPLLEFLEYMHILLNSCMHLCCPASGARPAGWGKEHHSPGAPAAPGDSWNSCRVHDLCQPLGGAQNPGEFPSAGAAAPSPATTPGVLLPAGGQRQGQGVHHQYKVTGSSWQDFMSTLAPKEVHHIVCACLILYWLGSHAGLVLQGLREELLDQAVWHLMH